MTEDGIQCQVCGKITGLSVEDTFTCDPVCSEECSDKWKNSPDYTPPQGYPDRTVTIHEWGEEE
jgi:hypothetical protein